MATRKAHGMPCIIGSSIADVKTHNSFAVLKSLGAKELATPHSGTGSAQFGRSPTWV